MKTTPIATAVLLSLMLASCGDKADSARSSVPAGPDAPAQTDAPYVEASHADTTQAASGLPQADMNKPLNSYPELQSGQQIMFLYVAASKLPPDYAKLADYYSDEYRGTSDNFRKNDLLKAIKPQLEQKIQQAEANPYAWMQVDGVNLGPYDFERKGFPVNEFEGNRERYFYDSGYYRLTWANADQMRFVSVSDETKAREIESLRTQSAIPAKIYFFAQSADLNRQMVQAYVTHVVITDQSGRALVEYGPQGG
jgi:hypothetical protein